MALATTKRKNIGKLDQAAKDELLRSALEFRAETCNNWDSARQLGATDEELRKLVQFAFSLEGGWVNVPGTGEVCFRTTYGFPIWFGCSTPPTRPPDLSADKLLLAVRRVMQIELPKSPAPTNGRHQANGDHHVAGDLPPSQTSTTLPDGIANQAARRSGKTARANGRSNGQLPQQPAPDAVTLPAAGKLTILEEIEIPVGKIFPSPENPREDFDQAFLEHLGQSILDHGQLTPLSVRTPNVDGQHEIIDGETRYRAAKLKGIETLRCSIVECSDGDAALARVLSYRQRRDLNPLEEARGLKLLLQKYGCTQRELETKIGLSQGQISNRIRLLKLTKPWRQRVISREITASQARDLAAWNDEPAVAAELDAEWKRNKGRFDFERELCDAISQASHELKGYEFSVGGNWSIDLKDAAVKQLLRIKSCPGWNGSTSPRAFNVKLAEQLKREAIEKLKAKSAKKSERSEASAKRADLSPAERRQKAEQLKAQQAKKIYRYKVAWLHRRLQEIFDEGCIQITTPLLITWLLWFSTQSGEYTREQELQKLLGGKKDFLEAMQAYAGDIDQAGALLRRVLSKWLEHSFEGWRTDLPPAAVESFALQAGVDVAKEWRLDQDFLELFTKDSLLELCDEWKITAKDLPGGGLETLKRSELISEILRIRPNAKTPERLLKVKAVSLR